ncbi:M28 family peptidase [Ectothiorhodospiraceae bacterium 2226]|nr:M28 family peptidase [Ectothiorhodospiraceae bacterium 2226]
MVWKWLLWAVVWLGLAALLAAGAVTLLLVQPVWQAQPERVALRVDPERLERHVRMLAEEFVPRNYAHPENLDRVAAYIGEQFAAAGAAVSEQVYTADGRTYRNVIARFGPATEERLVVGAHYDTDGEQPGADDNASGVAGLLELARLLQGEALPLRVELVGYTLEEMPYAGTPYMGSAVHARALREAGVPVRLMISLEMLGYFRDEPGSQRYPSPLLRLFYPDRGDFIAVVGRFLRDWQVRPVKRAMRGATPLPVYSINAPADLPGIAWSDHGSFWAEGYDALMITDTAFYRNPHYHTVHDLPHTLDYRRMAYAVQATHAALLAIAHR